MSSNNSFSFPPPALFAIERMLQRPPAGGRQHLALYTALWYGIAIVGGVLGVIYRILLNDNEGASIKDVPTQGGRGHHNGDRGEGVKVNKDVPFKY